MEEIPFFRPDIGDEEIKSVEKVVRSGHLTAGKIVKKFEDKFGKFIGAERCIATNSLTNGYLMVLNYLNPKWVDMPSLTFVSMANIPKLLGIDLKFRDRVYIGRKYTIKTDKADIVDSAHELSEGMYENDEKFWLFSFYANKNMTTGGEGGMIVCPDDESYDYLKETKDCGIIAGQNSWDYVIRHPGWYSYMTDYCAAMGIIQLDRLNEINANKWKIVKYYNDLLNESNSSLHLYTIFVENRDKFMSYMKNNEIECSIHYMTPIHLQPAFNDGTTNLPKTEDVAKKIVSLPLFSKMKKNQVRRVCELVNEWRGV